MNLDYEDAQVSAAAARLLEIQVEDLLRCTVIRRSIDARGTRARVRFNLSVEVEVENYVGDELLCSPGAGSKFEAVKDSGSSAFADINFSTPEKASSATNPPVVVGAGPAGLLAAWRLSQAGLKPILIERGAPVENRNASVGKFWAQGQLDPEDNVLFGEGGAGLFSDGKLTTRSKLRSELHYVMKLLVECGAPESIFIDAEPHVGSDKLAEILPQIRERIKTAGGEVLFHSRLEAFDIDQGRLAGVIVNGQHIPTQHCLLATGHSARDVYKLLQQSQVALEAKPFAAGVRIEVPQTQIDLSQFGQDAGNPRLGAASFRLTRKPGRDTRACYSFCMCPGGTVMACASSPGELTTNGMSMSSRSQTYGNAGFLVPVTPDDFESDDPLAGLAWQAEIETKAFRAGGSDYSLPACTLPEFLAKKDSADLPNDRSWLRSITADLHQILPDFVRNTLLHNVPIMLRKMEKVQLSQGLVYAAETRSSSPVRIVRDESFQSTSTKGLYPAGEGAGYAGGIITSAIDGLRSAEAMLAEMTSA